MMRKTTLARPYARALFEIARDTDSMVLWSDQLSLWCAIIQDPTIARLIEDRGVSKSLLTQIFLEGGGTAFSAKAQAFIRLLVSHRRLGLLPDMLALYEKLCLESQQKLKVHYESVKPLSLADRERVTQIFSEYFDKTVVLEEQINTHLIGGYRARAGSVVMDASIAGYLAYLKGARV